MHFLLSTRTHVAWGQGRTNHGPWVSKHTHTHTQCHSHMLLQGNSQTSHIVPLSRLINNWYGFADGDL